MATRKLTVQILGDSKSLERAFRTSGKQSTQWGTAVKRAGVVAAAGVAAFALTAGKVVKASSNLNEQINKSNVVFGQNAKDVQQWSTTTANAFGISQAAALEAASGFGAMLQTAGITEKASADMSKSITSLAGDMASFNNISTTDALDKLRSGLAGEAEPLRRYGVFLSETAVKQEAYRSGIAKTGDELTEAQKVQARYNLIMRQTAKQQGDAARTSESFANATRRISAQIEDNAAKIGNRLLPVVARAVSGIAGMIDELGQARTIGAKFDVVVENVTALGRSIARQIGDAVAKVNWSAVFKRAEGIAEGLRERLEETDFSVVGKRIGEAFSDAARVALPAAKQIADRVSAAVREIDWEALGKAMGPGLAAAVATAFVALTDPAFWARNWDLALAIALTVFTRGIGRFAARIGSVLLRAIVAGVSRISPRLAEVLVGLGVTLVQSVATGFRVLGPLLTRALAPIAGVVRAVFRRLGRLATFTVKVLGIQAVINVITEMAADVRRVFGRIGGFISEVFRDAVRKVLEFVRKVLGVTSILGRFDPFKGLREKVERQLKAMEDDADKTARNVNRSLSGIKDQTVSLTINVRTTTELGAGRRPEEGALGHPGAVAAATKSAKDATDTVTKGAKTIYNTIKGGATTTKRTAAQIAKAREEQRKAFEAAMEALDLDVDIATGRGALRRALGFLNERERALLAQIKVEGRTTDLLRRLHETREQQAAILEQMREQGRAAQQARQFRALGLTAEGEKPPPTIANLIKQWQALNRRIQGTPLDRTFGSTMDAVIKVLRNKTDRATEVTRQWIKDFFGEIRSGFEQGGEVIEHTAAQALNANKIMAGLGLSPEEMRKLRGRLSKFTTAGVSLPPSTRATAFGAVAGGPSPVTVENTIYLDGAVIARSTKRFLDNDRIHNPKQKRGPNAGR